MRNGSSHDNTHMFLQSLCGRWRPRIITYVAGTYMSNMRLVCITLPTNTKTCKQSPQFSPCPQTFQAGAQNVDSLGAYMSHTHDHTSAWVCIHGSAESCEYHVFTATLICPSSFPDVSHPQHHFRLLPLSYHPPLM